jgi:alanine racemase
MSAPTESIFVPDRRKVAARLTNGPAPPPPPEDKHRAVHRIRLSALQHNFAFVESTAARQRCSVIAVVKADGYGHGAIATALHLADRCGADAFAVATLEEAISLRRAFERNPPGRWSKQLAALFHTGGIDTATTSLDTASAGTSRPNSPQSEVAARVMRPAQIRILVLGPPVGFPRCFDDYYHHGIEVMVSGPEVVQALMEWVLNEKERKRTQVQRAAMEAKAHALTAPMAPRESANWDEKKDSRENLLLSDPQGLSDPSGDNHKKALRHPSSTLGNVSGQDLANEVRAMLIKQKAATDAANVSAATGIVPKASTSNVASTVNSSESSVSSDPKSAMTPPKSNVTVNSQHSQYPGTKQLFGGIEAAARTSRNRAQAAAHVAAIFHESEHEASAQQPLAPNNSQSTAPANSSFPIPAGSTPATRKRLRWHALVDSGMGRLGFKTEPVKKEDALAGRRDTVEILQDMLDAEINGNAPIEFYGMCTHMAEATATSDYTKSQIAKFINLLKRVRSAGIYIPTVSTDNSAALLTTNLTHFNPSEILSQKDSDTRGFVRTGGAIYGQRPAFDELQAVSTLLASVRHVAILKQGESVGYDRAYIAPYNVRIATLTIGFADGYPRELGNGVGKVQIRGSVFPVAGNVCMDMLMIELGPAEDKDIGSTVAVGDTAVLWGPLDENDDYGMVRLQDLATTLKTTQSALTCGLDKIRVLRQFV